MAQSKNPWGHRRWRGGVCRSGLGARALAFWVMAAVPVAVLAGLALKVPRLLGRSSS